VTQVNLFGEPELSPALSQWHTPDWIARRLAAWVPMGARVLEPSCGFGNLIAALQRVNQTARVTAIELDPASATHCRQRFELNSNVRVINADFKSDSWGRFDVVLMNPPFENGLHAEFLDIALDCAPVVLAILPVATEFGEERDRTFWARKGRVTRRARLPERVKYGGDSQASFETVALRVERRADVRLPGELTAVIEEVWREGE
jgi:predicted RNA methylase